MNSIHNIIGTMLLFHMWPTAINCSYLHPIFYLGPFQYLKSMSSCIQKWFKSMGTTPMSRFLHFSKKVGGAPQDSYNDGIGSQVPAVIYRTFITNPLRWMHPLELKIQIYKISFCSGDNIFIHIKFEQY